MYYVAWVFAAATTWAIGFGLGNGSVIALNAPSGPSAWLPAVFLQHVERYGSEDFAATSLTLFSHSWSVALEEQFYFVMAPLAFILLRKRSLAFTLGIGVALVGCSANDSSAERSPFMIATTL